MDGVCWFSFIILLYVLCYWDNIIHCEIVLASSVKIDEVYCSFYFIIYVLLYINGRLDIL